ncbi:putative selenate ABC transporter substrate-binding protein [Bacillus sp. cl95]|uniref:putative selenate ABC transporter substrate-binding protein n=2 Tax=unclassified Bacillus (in: firmicutes) TaxID=185979 RepID=UPI0008EA5E5E|nr:putative selenate ABC transporter substrate-binding protein [Bacillus sp. cl95]SFA88805.1 phosphonate transport system substrate-binding protein [Bacillus sp. UNCCL13]SFQ84703.1 phosphonate transport system substrate-binding protein [Bacillus sp. cl95]
MMKKWIIGILMALFLISMTACSQKEEVKNKETKQEVLKIGAIPDQNAADLNRSMDKVAEYLAKETGMKVEFVPSVDYAALVTAFERGEIHLAWFGGLTGVQAHNLVPEAEAIAQRPRDAEFHSVFIAAKDSGITELEDLKGKTFTFGSESSTSGHLMPRFFLNEKGIDPKKDFEGQPNFSGSHDTTYKLVESGAFQAGALNEAVWEAAVAEKKVDTSKVDVFYTTPAYYDYHWMINKIDKDTKSSVKKALLEMDSEQKEILDFFQTDKFIETKNENYKAIEKVAKELEIIK